MPVILLTANAVQFKWMWPIDRSTIASREETKWKRERPWSGYSKVTYRTVESKSEEHHEENESPEGWTWHRGNSFGINNEYQSWSFSRHVLSHNSQFKHQFQHGLRVQINGQTRNWIGRGRETIPQAQLSPIDLKDSNRVQGQRKTKTHSKTEKVRVKVSCTGFKLSPRSAWVWSSKRRLSLIQTQLLLFR